MVFQAFFEESLEATYNIIDRADFEARLKSTYDNGPSEADAGLYALRNIVFATGCRITTFKDCSWSEAQAQSQGYFENALAVEPDLIHGTPGLTGIQALFAMVCPRRTFCRQKGTNVIGILCRRRWYRKIRVYACWLCGTARTCEGLAPTASLDQDLF